MTIAVIPVGCSSPFREIDQLRGFIGAQLNLVQCRKRSVGSALRGRHPRVVVLGKACQALRAQCVNKQPDMLSRVLRYAVGTPADLFKQGIYSVLPVKELPDVYARGVQAETVTRIGVEENGPVVKLFPEHDVRIGYGFVSLVQDNVVPSVY
jgi:hypothetical protein